MNIDEQLKQLSQQTYPKEVDVVDRVMAEVRKHPYLINPSTSPAASQSSSSTKRRWVPWVSLTAAAAAVGLVVVNINPAAGSYNEEQIGSMMAYVANSDNYYASVEAPAENPYEYLYDYYSDDDYSDDNIE